MPYALCGTWVGGDNPPTMLHWGENLGEGRTLCGELVFRYDTLGTDGVQAAVHKLRAQVAEQWRVRLYRVRVSEWELVANDGACRWPLILELTSEWIRWRLIECEAPPPSWPRLNVTRWRRAPNLELQTWYFICESCQDQKRNENALWGYSNINADGNASSGSEDSPSSC